MQTGEAVYGLIGRRLSHSFSRDYFRKKFQSLGLPFEYRNFELPDISEFPAVLAQEPLLKGLNVTIPYKESILAFVNKMSDDARQIGAVNCIRIADGTTIGYNTDWTGFTESIRPHLKSHHTHALVLGTGGSARAINHALHKLGVDVLFVSSTATRLIGETISYREIDADVMKSRTIIVNCTPLGMSPDMEGCPDLPFEHLTPNHLVVDLIYNPEQTRLLKRASENGAVTMNGYRMLVAQAEKSWEIWNSDT